MKLLSEASEYALRAVVWLAQDASRPEKVREIAEATHAAPGYLVKVLQNLAKAGILSAQRGTRGGFVLIRDPAGLSVLEVISAVDPVERIQQCPLQLDSHRERLCPMHERIDQALAMVEAAFGGTMIADLLNAPEGPQPLREAAEPVRSTSAPVATLDG
jgi:Rrf2 family transcriptional regulator, nitric oxide-sensitive transcriptional repressor